jgi:exonuclease III
MSKITVQVASWNLNCKKPNFKLKFKNLLSQQSPCPDLICVGLQEIHSQVQVLGMVTLTLSIATHRTSNVL